MVLLELFWSFAKIGFTSFGGLSMIPLISSEMLGHGWMTTAEVSDIVAIAEMTPGPLGLNCATYAGLKVAGLLGAIITNLGVLSPTLTVGLLAAVFIEAFKKNRRMGQFMVGVRPACIGLILGVLVGLMQTNFFIGGTFSPVLAGIAALDMFLLVKFKLGVPVIIGISAVLGILFVR